MTLLIKKIKPNDTIPIRHIVLRSGKPIESCYFEGDNLETTRHFGIFQDEKLLGIVSLFKNNHPQLPAVHSYQIRGMAVLPQYQKKGLGNLLINHCENIVKIEKSSLIWFNARENAKGFYEKLNFKTYGNPFEIKNIGIHYLMFKTYEN